MQIREMQTYALVNDHARLTNSDEGLRLETSVFESFRWLIYLIDLWLMTYFSDVH